MGKNTRLVAMPVCLLPAGWIVVRALADEKTTQIIQVNVNQHARQYSVNWGESFERVVPCMPRN
jgi:hypothetical protein